MLKLELKLANDVINGFSYSFSKALLDTLKDAFEKEEVFEKSYLEQEEIMQRHCGQELAFDFAPSFYPVCQYLGEQTIFSNFGSNYKGVQRLIEHAEKFLSIFETRKEQVDTDDLVGDITQLINDGNLADQVAVNIVWLLHSKYKLL